MIKISLLKSSILLKKLKLSLKIHDPKLIVNILFSYSGTNDIINACKNNGQKYKYQ